MSAPLSAERLERAYRQMKTIREFEERLHVEIATGEIPGFTHLYAGQEAVAVGVCEHLDDADYIVSTHRGHGHCIAKGCDVTGMMLEIYGRADGLCKGKGGSMHIADVDQGHARRQRDRRRRAAARRRRGDRLPQSRQRARQHRVRRRRQLQPGHGVRGHEHGRRAQGAGDLRDRGQRLQRAHRQGLRGGLEGHRGPRARLRHAGRTLRRRGLLRGVRSRRSPDRQRAPRRRPVDAGGDHHALLRPLRGRPAAVPREGRGQAAARNDGLPQELPRARDGRRLAHGRDARRDRRAGPGTDRDGRGDRPRPQRRRPSPKSKPTSTSPTEPSAHATEIIPRRDQRSDAPGDGARQSRNRAGRGRLRRRRRHVGPARGFGRHLRRHQGSAAEIRRGSRHRHADLRIRHHRRCGRRRARRPAARWRN